MKNIFIRIVGICLTIIAVLFITPIFTKNNLSTQAMVIDLVNPAVKKEEVYLLTTDRYHHTQKNNVDQTKDYVYHDTSYTPAGKERTLSYTSFGKKLTPYKYLKLTTKGQCVRKWEEVSLEEVPKDALNKLGIITH